uniref:Lamin-1 n=1 Tax=Ascaris suum TaxID=6253 RepID=F1KU65_ASCSU
MSTKQTDRRSKDMIHEREGQSTIDNNTEDINSLNTSVMSTSCQTRLLERETLSNLNDRLAVLINRVRKLEMENSRLNIRISESEMPQKDEEEHVRERYEAKISELRAVMDESIKQQRCLAAELQTILVERNRLLNESTELDITLKQAEKSRLDSDSVVHELQARINSAISVRKHLENENKSIAAEILELKPQLEVLRSRLEDETLANAVLRNQTQSLREDYGSLKKVQEEHLEAIRHSRQLEMSNRSRELERTYESHLQEQLRAMRTEFDARLSENRQEIDEIYKDQLKEANKALQQATEAREESARKRACLRDLEERALKQENRLSFLEQQIVDLESQLRFVENDTNARVQERDARIAELQQEIDRMLSEYKDLLGLKVQLDTELRAYETLLEGEESRLNISRQSSMSAKGFSEKAESGDIGDSISPTAMQLASSGCAVRRKRFIASGDSSYFPRSAYKTKVHPQCEFEIDAHSGDGQFVRLVNKSNKDVSIGKWSIKSLANEREIVYKFHPRQTIKAGNSVTVWSAGSGKKSAPPSCLVMKKQQWPTGDHVRTVLVDPAGMEKATFERIDGQQVIEEKRDTDQQCLLM